MPKENSSLWPTLLLIAPARVADLPLVQLPVVALVVASDGAGADVAAEQRHRLA